jgi:hypothetical protein
MILKARNILVIHQMFMTSQPTQKPLKGVHNTDMYLLLVYSSWTQ